MSEIGLAEIIGHWIAIFVTIAILSYLYADNPFYKLAEHLFVGTSIGYVIVIQFFEVMKPNLIDRLMDPSLGASRVVYVVPLMLVVFLFLRFSKQWSWMSRLAIAFVIGIYAGQNVPAYANTDLVAQLGSTVESVNGYAGQVAASDQGTWAAIGATWTEAAGLSLLVFGMAAGLVYFFFSIEHKGVVGGIARVGVWILMLGFGASFGYTVQGRISLAIGRAMFCTGLTESEAEAAAYHSKLVSVICLVVVFGTAYYLERRKRKAEGESGAESG